MILEELGLGLTTTLICMAIVFTILIVLSYVIRLQRIIVEKIEGKGNKQATKAQIAPQAAKPEVQKAEEDDGELLAVISAAVAAALGRSASNIIVKSIRRVEPETLTWSLTGRQEQVSSRF